MRFFLTFLALCIATPALADTWSGEWSIDTRQSRIRFTATQDNEPFSGRFHAFTAAIVFNPERPHNGRITVTIPLANVTVDGKDRQEAILAPDWFNVKRFPKARFTSNDIASDGKGGFIAKGRLTIKGVSRDLALPFTLTTMGDVTRADGSFTLNRADFGIGTGEYASDQWIKHEVKVDISIVARKK